MNSDLLSGDPARQVKSILITDKQRYEIFKTPSTKWPDSRYYEQFRIKGLNKKKPGLYSATDKDLRI